MPKRVPKPDPIRAPLNRTSAAVCSNLTKKMSDTLIYHLILGHSWPDSMRLAGYSEWTALKKSGQPKENETVRQIIAEHRKTMQNMVLASGDDPEGALSVEQIMARIAAIAHKAEASGDFRGAMDALKAYGREAHGMFEDKNAATGGNALLAFFLAAAEQELPEWQRKPATSRN